MNAVRSSLELYLLEARICVSFVKTLASCSTVIIWLMNERMCLSPHKLNRGNSYVVQLCATDDTKDYKRKMVAHFWYVTIHHYC